MNVVFSCVISINPINYETSKSWRSYPGWHVLFISRIRTLKILTKLISSWQSSWLWVNGNRMVKKSKQSTKLNSMAVKRKNSKWKLITVPFDSIYKYRNGKSRRQGLCIVLGDLLLSKFLTWILISEFLKYTFSKKNKNFSFIFETDSYF